MKQTISLVCSVTALVLATLGSTPLGEAARKAVQAVPRGSVGTLQLKRNAVTSSKLAPNSVRTGQIVDGSLLTTDFKPGQIPQGPKGDKGDRGPTGPPGISGYQVVDAMASVPANTTLQSVQAKCPTGKQVLGGTAAGNGGASGLFFSSSFSRSTGGNGPIDLYSVIVTNTTAAPKNAFVRATCARVAG